MALALQPTLGELRTATLERCGLATEGNVPKTIQAIIDEKIRSAQKQIYELFPWLQTYVQRNITLVMNQAVYDIPDDTEPGKITFIAVRRSSDGWLLELEPGIRPAEMNYVNPTPVAGTQPLRYDFINQSLFIAPVPDTTYYDVLQLNYYQIPGAFIEDEERAVVDGEALKMLSEILVKTHFGGQDTKKLEDSFERYAANTKGRQSNGAGIMMGGHRSLVGRTRRRNRFAWSDLQGGSNSRYWTPWL